MGAGASSSKAGAAGSKSNGSKPMSRSGTSTLARAATGLNLRLSQRLRRFLGRDFSAFALQSNPSLAHLASTLTADGATGRSAGRRGRALR